MVKVLINFLEYLGYKVYVRISYILPLSLAYFLADLVGYMVCIFTPRETRVRARIMQRIKENIETPTPKPLFLVWECRPVIRNTQYFNRDLVDFFKSGRLDSEDIDSFVKVEGLEYLDNALTQQKGVVLASSHFGSWEMAGVCLAIKGYSIFGMVWEPKNKWVARMFERIRSAKGVGAVSSGSLREVLELLQKNSAIGIMVDVDGGVKGIPYELWGYNVRLPRGPAAIAFSSGAVLLVVVMMRLPGGGYRMIIEKPLVTDDEKNNTIEMFKIIKKYIQQDPIQWHWLKYFWSREHE